MKKVIFDKQTKFGMVRRGMVGYLFTHSAHPGREFLVTRGTERVPNNPGWWLGMRIMEPAAFIMTRRMLLGVKERAETLRASASDDGLSRIEASASTAERAGGVSEDVR